jgi:F-type H+-transporting ATPase subunit gamma
MSDSLESLRHKIAGAQTLQSVVGAMKAVTASSIGQYEAAVLGLEAYYHTVELGLSVCLRHQGPPAAAEAKPVRRMATGVVVFGSDQGLVGPFNSVLTDFVVAALNGIPGEKRIWAVGERVHASLVNAGIAPAGLFEVPTSVNTITALVSQILIECTGSDPSDGGAPLYLFRNRPTVGAIYEPASQRLLPLDDAWWHGLLTIRWPSGNLPEVLGDPTSSLTALVREYLFVSLFRACAESLDAENASRLAAMQRAEKNIDDLLGRLQQKFNRQRQSAIDEELFDVVSGFEALSGAPASL